MSINIKSMIPFFVIVALIPILIFVCAQIDKSPKWNWILNDLSNPYIESSVIRNVEPEIAVKWWKKVMSDPERRYFAVNYPQPHFNWTEINDIWKRWESGKLPEWERDQIYMDMAKSGKGFLTDPKRNYVIEGFKVVPLTPLDEKGMKIQEEMGCKGCHVK